MSAVIYRAEAQRTSRIYLLGNVSYDPFSNFSMEWNLNGQYATVFHFLRDRQLELASSIHFFIVHGHVKDKRINTPVVSTSCPG